MDERINRPVLKRIQAQRFDPENNCWKVEGFTFDINDEQHNDLAARWAELMRSFGYEVIMGTLQ